jgi:tRNA A37 threonylcarbamoyladenosine synthetase subunit TsaC/SUA5/YrdC
MRRTCAMHLGHYHGALTNWDKMQAELQQPLLGTTLILPGDDEPLTDPEMVRERLEKQVDLIVDGGACSFEPTTVIDLSGAEPELVRQGRGDPAVLGL